MGTPETWTSAGGYSSRDSGLRSAGTPARRRAPRIVALLRKSPLFAGGEEPAQTHAEQLSLLSTCQLHDVEPKEWLADILLAVHEPAPIVLDLLPWNWKATPGSRYTPYFDTR